MRLFVVLAVMALSGCAATLESTSERIDDVEAAVRDARVNYQERWNRVTVEWLCTGMSWPDLVSLVGGDRELLDAIMAACAGREYPELGE